jgi:hypothetical protein
MQILRMREEWGLLSGSYVYAGCVEGAANFARCFR